MSFEKGERWTWRDGVIPNLVRSGSRDRLRGGMVF